MRDKPVAVRSDGQAPWHWVSVALTTLVPRCYSIVAGNPSLEFCHALVVS